MKTPKNRGIPSLLALVAAVAATPAWATEYVVELTQAQLVQEIEDQEALGRHLVDVEVTPVSGGGVSYSGVFKPLSNGVMHIILYADPASWDTWIADMNGRDGRWLDFEIDYFDPDVRRSGIFWASGSENYRERLDSSATDAEFQTLLQTYRDDGLAIIDFESYKDAGGNTLYGGLWVDGERQPRTVLYYGLDLFELQDLIYPQQGRIVDYERYWDGQNRLRFAVILAMYPGGESLMLDQIDAPALATLDSGRSDNLIDLDTYEVAPGLMFYAAVWGDDWKSLREVDPYSGPVTEEPGPDVTEIVTAFEAGNQGTLGLYAKNVYGGQSIGYREDEPFYLASTAKLAVHVRLWQLHQQGDLDINSDVMRYGSGTGTPVPWYVDERPGDGLSTMASCGDSSDMDILLSTLDSGMMTQSDNAATSMLVDHPTLGLGTFDPDLNEWVSGLPGVARGFGILTSIQDLDRVIAWQAQWPNSSHQPSFFLAPRAGLETLTRGGSLGYWQCQDSMGAWVNRRCMGPSSCQMSCLTGQTCVPRADPWGDLASYMMSHDSSWTPGDPWPSFDYGVGYPRYYGMGLNWATPRAFGALQEQFVTGQLLDEDSTAAALNVMIQSNAPLQSAIPPHIQAYSKGGQKGGTNFSPCSDTTIFQVGPDAVVLNVHTKNNLRPCSSCPAGNPGCTTISAFWQSPATPSGNPLGQVVLRRMLPDLDVADPQVASFGPTTIRPGQAFDILGDVSNTGGVGATFPVDFVVSSDTVIGDADDQIIVTVQVSAAPGETVRARFSGMFPTIPDGAYWVGFVVDPPRPGADPPLPFGAVGEFTENLDTAYLGVDARLTVLPPAPACQDLDLDGFYDCQQDCDPTGLTCGDCNDDSLAVRPTATEICNQLDDDCDGSTDPGALVAGALDVVVDPDPETSDEFGNTLAVLPDFDGDGIHEFAVGQHRGDSPIKNDAGEVRVYSGATRDLHCVVYDLYGEGSDRFGTSITGLDDVNGNGEPGFAVGSPRYAGDFGSQTGSVSVFWGETCNLYRRLQDPSASPGDEFGTSVASVGDITLDGVPEIAIGAPLVDHTGSNRGSVFVFDVDRGDLVWELSDPASPNGDRIGEVLAGPGDLNNDLIPDIVTSSTTRNGSRGVILVFSGIDGSLMDTWSLPAAAASNKLGQSLAALGDVTGDGVPDIVAGEIDGDTLAGNNTGDAVIFSGADGAYVRTLWDPNGETNDDFGHSVANAGDQDGDGWDDVIVGAPLHEDADAGNVMVFSSQTGFPLFDLEDPNGRAGDELGSAVAGVGDQNGDGKWEIAASAQFAHEIEAANAGRVLVWSLESDCDADGVTPFDGDCDDQDGTVGRGMPELCDTLDNDCDLLVDEDNDGDTFDVCNECNDSDARIYPGAVERCNGIDDDCDTEIDEGGDADLDTYTDVCDCNDGDAAVNPGQSDLVCDRVDQDCNGVTDDGFAMPAGARLLDLGAGRSAEDNFGTSLAVVGDLTSDGVVEFAVGVPLEDTAAGGAGAVAVFDGATGVLHCLLTDPDAAGFDLLGTSVAAAGDITGDGVADILAGVPGDDDPLGGAGSVVVFSGTDCSAFYKAFDPMSGTGDKLGETVTSVGDLNGDGKPEYAAAAPAADLPGLTNPGRVTIFDGASGNVIWRLYDTNPRANQEFGDALAGGRDLDADGVPDLVVGNPLDNTGGGSNTGSLVVFSLATGEPMRKIIDLEGGPSDQLGTSVALIDDMNGDAVADIVAGAINDDDAANNGGAVLIFSGVDGTRIGKAGYPEAGLNAAVGTSIAVVPDIDGDGVDDIAAGAARDDEGKTDSGSVLLISGIDLSLIAKMKLTPGQASAQLGRSVAVAPDLSGDGMADILAGVPLQDQAEGTDVGQVVIFALEADCDGDGVSPFGGDCDDGNGNAATRPGDPESLLFSDKENASWMPPADPGGSIAGLSYDVIRSSDASDFTTAADCLESDDGADTAAQLTATPASGAVFHYLVRAENICDAGPAGYDSALVERGARSCP